MVRFFQDFRVESFFFWGLYVNEISLQVRVRELPYELPPLNINSKAWGSTSLRSTLCKKYRIKKISNCDSVFRHIMLLSWVSVMAMKLPPNRWDNYQREVQAHLCYASPGTDPPRLHMGVSERHLKP